MPIWGFVAITLPLAATPGASTAIVLRNSMVGGARAGLLMPSGAVQTSWAFAGAPMARILSSGAPLRALEMASGIALLALAVKVTLG